MNGTVENCLKASQTRLTRKKKHVGTSTIFTVDNCPQHDAQGWIWLDWGNRVCWGIRLISDISERDGMDEGGRGVAPMKKLLWKDKQAEALLGFHIGKSQPTLFHFHTSPNIHTIKWIQWSPKQSNWDPIKLKGFQWHLIASNIIQKPSNGCW